MSFKGEVITKLMLIKYLYDEFRLFLQSLILKYDIDQEYFRN